MGYYRAGFDVLGVDINPQPNYPFEFHRADASKFPLRRWKSDYAVIHASPPCQANLKGLAAVNRKLGRSYDRQRSTVVQVYGNGADRHQWGPALGIDWMNYGELAQAIPPAYTEYIGAQIIASIAASAA